MGSLPARASIVDNLATRTTFEALVRIIKTSFLREAARRHPNAAPALRAWQTTVEAATWGSFDDVRRTFSFSDAVRVASGRQVVVFNISGNNYRLICAIHFNHQRIFALRFLTHAEYDKARWKTTL